ncbi:hypothetical protein PCCS19_18890 [Paenibacillus sp. CCS19]|nr:hypothetical protein PCCS19_18890 [Paenibacillus cellulosilyticus]
MSRRAETFTNTNTKLIQDKKSPLLDNSSCGLFWVINTHITTKKLSLFNRQTKFMNAILMLIVGRSSPLWI